MYPPTAMAESGPTFWAVEAVPRIVLTRPAVNANSVSIACQPCMPALGNVAPSLPLSPEYGQQERTRQRRVRELRKHVPEAAPPGEVATQRGGD